MDLIVDKSRIPARKWKWNENETNYEGVYTGDGCLIWFTCTNIQEGNILKAEQSYEDFIRDGPLNDSIPADIMVELYDCVMNAVSGGGGMLF